ncbi:hypothetical protein AB0C51_16830 [Streptomyces pathocidini]
MRRALAWAAVQLRPVAEYDHQDGVSAGGDGLGSALSLTDGAGASPAVD